MTAFRCAAALDEMMLYHRLYSEVAIQRRRLEWVLRVVDRDGGQQHDPVLPRKCRGRNAAVHDDEILRL